MPNRPQAAMRAEEAQHNAAAEVPLAMERALKLGVPRRALAKSAARVLGLALVAMPTKENRASAGTENAA